MNAPGSEETSASEPADAPGTSLSRFPPWIQALRIHQWSKNAFVLAALVYSHHLGDAPQVHRAALAFLAFCLASSAGYLVNDLEDRESDRLHPRKRLRPIASGRLSTAGALGLAALCYAGGFALALLVSNAFAAILLAYVVQTLAYTYALKRVVILDVFLVANGFVLRAVGGGVAVGVEISPWLVLCTVTLSLFLGFSKRRSEIVALGENAARHRSILAEYNLVFLDQMISITATSTALAYATYTASPQVVARTGQPGLIATTPFVFFGIFRYLYLLHVRGVGSDPARALVSDRPLLATCLSWALFSIAILYLS